MAILLHRTVLVKFLLSTTVVAAKFWHLLLASNTAAVSEMLAWMPAVENTS